MKSEDLVWFTYSSKDKKVVLESMGYRIDSEGHLYKDGKEIKALDDPEISIKYSDVKAIVPGSTKVITDISEIEMIFSND